MALTVHDMATTLQYNRTIMAMTRQNTATIRQYHSNSMANTRHPAIACGIDEAQHVNDDNEEAWQ